MMKIKLLVLLVLLMTCVNEDICKFLGKYEYAEINILNKKNIRCLSFEMSYVNTILIFNDKEIEYTENKVQQNFNSSKNILSFKAIAHEDKPCLSGEEGVPGPIHDRNQSDFYRNRKRINNFSSIDTIKLPIKLYDSNNNFIFQITNSLSKISNPQFDDNEKLIKGTITIDQSFIDNPFNGTKNED